MTDIAAWISDAEARCKAATPMTRDEILALGGRALDAAVISAFGFEPYDRQWWIGNEAEKTVAMTFAWERKDLADRWALEHAEYMMQNDWTIYLYDIHHRYSSDRNAAALVLREIERRGKMCAFVDQLEDILWPINVDLPEAIPWAWTFLTASPRDLCRAVLLAVEGE